MSAVLSVVAYADEDGGGETVMIVRALTAEWSQVHSVDIGDTAYTLADVTHRTRDGHAMVVLYDRRHGYTVSVHTGDPS